MKAIVTVEVAAVDNHSILKSVYAQTPFKILNITEDKKNNPLHLMLMSSSPGILDGDFYDIKITIAKLAAVQLHTQAYQRLFQMKLCATQRLEVRLSDGAAFCFLPHPTVPHFLSSFTNKNYFYLGSNCRFVYGEVLTCGRKLNGEAFVFSKYHSITNLYLNEKLLLKENLLMMPQEINVAAIGQLEGFTHQASFIFLQDAINLSEVSAAIAAVLSPERNLEIGISSLASGGVIVRMMGQGAEQLFQCMQRINGVLPPHTVKVSTDVS